jgi:hypothetical protein
VPCFCLWCSYNKVTDRQIVAPIGDGFGRGDKPLGSRTNNKIWTIAQAGGLGRSALVFGDDEIVDLLRATVESEGGQVAFAKHHHINRTYLNMVLSGKRPVGDAVAEALGLHKVYAIE